jgi:hypothetical protein
MKAYINKRGYIVVYSNQVLLLIEFLQNNPLPKYPELKTEYTPNDDQVVILKINDIQYCSVLISYINSNS